MHLIGALVCSSWTTRMNNASWLPLRARSNCSHTHFFIHVELSALCEELRLRSAPALSWSAAYSCERVRDDVLNVVDVWQLSLKDVRYLRASLDDNSRPACVDTVVRPVHFSHADGGRHVIAKTIGSPVELSLELDAGVRVQVMSAVGQSTVRIDTRPCWHREAAFCSFAMARADLIALSLAALALLSAILIASYLLRTPTAVPDLMVRSGAWVVLLASSFLAASTFYPCAVCHDLPTVLLHELGHSLLLGHADGPLESRICGCGTAARRCDDVSSESSIMRSNLRPDLWCIGCDDADGVRTLWSWGLHAPCNDPTQCSDTQLAGPIEFVLRACIAVVYATTLAVVVPAIGLWATARYYAHEELRV